MVRSIQTTTFEHNPKPGFDDDPPIVFCTNLLLQFKNIMTLTKEQILHDGTKLINIFYFSKHCLDLTKNILQGFNNFFVE